MLSQRPQAPFGAHTITVSICVDHKPRLVLVDAVVGHMHTLPPAQVVDQSQYPTQSACNASYDNEKPEAHPNFQEELEDADLTT